MEQDRRHSCANVTWRVCPHIYGGEYLSERYKDLGAVTFVYGAVLCEDCCRQWRAERFVEILDRCEPMCDSCLLSFVINELCLINSQVLTSGKKPFHDMPTD